MIGKKLDNVEYVLMDIETFERFNAESYIINLFKTLGFKIKKSGFDTGLPDFIIENDYDTFYVEVKTNGDGLRYDQIKWLLNHPDKKVYVIFINQKTEKKKLQLIKKQRDTKEEELKELESLSKEAMGLL